MMTTTDNTANGRGMMTPIYHVIPSHMGSEFTGAEEDWVANRTAEILREQLDKEQIDVRVEVDEAIAAWDYCNLDDEWRDHVDYLAEMAWMDACTECPSIPDEE